MGKQISYWDDVRSKIFKWIETVAKTVTVTMWPKWRNVILEKEYWMPQVTNDGVTIAREVELEDKFESLGAELVKEAAEKTNSIAGDGTTTATLLTYALAKEGLRYIQSWVNAVELKNGMKKSVQIISDTLSDNSKDIDSKDEIAQVATVSAQDSVVGEIIAEAMSKVWNNGVISIEEGQTFGLELEITEWMEFDQGYMSHYMATNTEKMIAEYKNIPLLVTDQKLSNLQAFVPLLEKLVQSWQKDLVIIAEDLDSEVLTTLVLNKLKGIMNILAIKAPGYWDNKKELIKDLAILTWSKLIASDLWMKLENVELQDLWIIQSILSTQDKTTIVAGVDNSEAIDARVIELQNQREITDSNYNKDKLAERIAKLTGWVAMIKVWAASEVEMREKKLRIEDALNATRAAVSEWVVAGWWTALLKASESLSGVDLGNADQNIGLEIVRKALSYPVRQIAENAWKEGSVVINSILENTNINYWYDAAGDKYVDMIELGIIDPKKVERVALEEAVSLAWMFLTTESAIVKVKKDSIELPQMPQMPNMWGMWGMPMM